MALTLEQTSIIKSTVPILEAHGDTITRRFYANMLAAHPELKAIFNHANQFTNHQPAALAAALHAYARHIDNPAVLQPVLEKMCQKHVSLAVQPAQYDIVGAHLIGAMGEILGAGLTPEVKEAWARGYGQLAEMMIRREQELYAARGPWTDFRRFRIARKVRESRTITSFYLEPADPTFQLPAFAPGQYVSVSVFVPALGLAQPRQYSLTNAPGTSYRRISVKRDDGRAHPADPSAPAAPGLVSNVLHGLAAGAELDVSAPAGAFGLGAAEAAAVDEAAADAPVVLLSAGVGVTPMVGLLDALVAAGSPRAVSWIQGVRNTGEQAFGAHVRAVAREQPRVRVVVFNRNPGPGEVRGVDYEFAGRVDLDGLDREKDLRLDCPRARYFVCGPEGFMRDVLRELRELGVSDDRVQAEFFGTGMAP